MAKNEAKIKFSAETSEFNKQIKAANSRLGVLRAELGLNAAEMKETSDTADGLKKRQSLLTEELDAAAAKTQALREKMEAAVSIYGENSTEAMNLRKQVALAATAESKIRQEINKVNDALEAQTSESEDVESAVEDVESAVDDLNDTFKQHEAESEDVENALSKLKKTISAQETELEDLKDEYANATLEFGKNSREAKSLAKKISSLSDDLGENRDKMDAAERAADELADASKDSGNAAESASDGFTVWKGTLADLASSAIQGCLDAIKGLGETLWGLAEETREFRTSMGRVEVAFEGAGMSAEDATETYEDFYAVLGDEGKASEAVGLLSKLADSESELAGWTNAATGIYAEYGDSLPIEGLIEAANETVKTGKVTGNLADALNWTTLSAEEWEGVLGKDTAAMKAFSKSVKNGETIEDAFNAALSKCNDEQEREKLLRYALTTMYGDSAVAYRENNEQIIAANRAQARYNNALAGLGETIEPLTTAWTDGMATITEAFGDMLDDVDMELLVKGVEDAFEWIVDTAFPAIKTGIQWFLDNKRAVITGVTAIGGAFAGLKAMSVLKNIGSLFGLFKGGGGAGGGAGGGGGSLFGGFANMKPTTVLKGVTNLGIVIVALGGLAATVALFAPAITRMCDTGEFLKLVAAIGIVGLVGSALAKLAGIVGMIPVSVVAKGLANITIIMAGLGALTAAVALVAPVITDLVDGESFVELLELISVVGLVGAALAGLAGIVGLIPIPIVLSGLANVALAIGGFGGIAAALGALSRVDGFNALIADGGNVLITICSIIGEMAGVLIGAFGEGLTNFLPDIGANLSDFAESIKPMFDTFAGVDTEGLSEFATALGALILVLAGESLLSIITGGIDYAGLGEDLNTMAENLDGFFTTIENFSDGGFAKATALFDCLSGISALPKEGGIVSWFEGEVDYAKIADGLSELAGTADSFTSIQGIPTGAFAIATQLFDCLAGLKQLPADGGVVGWFMGEVDFAKIASGVQSLASAEMISALTSISTIPAGAFGTLTTMFDTLAGIKQLPAEGGIIGWFAGDSSTGLTNVSDKLPGVASSIKSFFDNLGGITDFTPIKTLFDTLNDIDIDTDVADTSFWTGTSSLGAMGAELSSFASNGATFFSTINTLNLENLSSFWDALAGASGLPASLSSLNADVGSALDSMLKTTQTKMDDIREEINLDEPKKDVSTSATSIVSTLNTKLTSAARIVASQFQSIHSTVGDKLGSALNTVSDNFERIVSAIRGKMADAKKAVGDAISDLRDKMDFSWSLPKLKLPHVSISGKFSIDPPSVPSFSVSWYKKGGILTQPTIFGASGNTLLGGGEAGPEAVAPIDVLLGYVRDAVRGVFSEIALGGVGAVADRVGTHIDAGDTGRMFRLMEDLASRPIIIDIDGNRVATATASASDNVSGNRLNLRTRGLALR